MNPTVLFLSLGAAFLYCVSAGLLHRAMSHGLSASSANLLCGVSMAVIMQAFWGFPVEEGWLAQVWRPVLCGVLFFFAQLLTMASLRRSGVGITTPLLGAKVLFVLLFLFLLGASELSVRWWGAAVLCFGGICLVSFQKNAASDKAGSSNHRLGALLALASAACFGLMDALYQAWVGFTGPGAFAPVLFATLAACSIGYSMGGNHGGRAEIFPAGIPRSILLLALLGGILGAVQAGMMAVAIGYFQEAALANLAYGTRALIAVVLGWLIFPALPSRGAQQDTGYLVRVFAGAVFIFASLVVVLYP